MTPADSGTTPSLHPYAGRQTVPAGPAGARTPGPSDGDGSQPVDGAPPAEDLPATTAGPESPDPAPEPGGDPRIEGRRQLRAARKRRRRLSIGCAVLIALCTAVTLLIVAIARDHTPDPLVVTPPAVVVSSPSFAHHPVPAFESTETLGALAPQGGQR